MEDSGEKARLRCSSCDFTHWNNPVPVLAAIVEYDGRILLARNAAWENRMFALITGFMEAGESAQGGITPEIREETSLQTDSLDLIGVYEFHRMNQVIIAYHAVCTGTVQLSAELAEYRLFEPHQLRCWPAGTGFALADWLRSRGQEPQFMDWSRPADSPVPPTLPDPGKRMHIDKELDTRGLNCPLPILKAKKALAEMTSGQLLRVVSTDAGSTRDFQAFARQTGNELVEQQTAGTDFIHVLRRR